MNIAIIGSGAREHAIAWHLNKVNDNRNIYIFSNKNGIDNSIVFDISNFDLLKKYCIELDIQLIIVGSEEFLANGIVDFFKLSNIQVFGPNEYATQLESSKIWAKTFMKKHGVKTVAFESFDNVSSALRYLKDTDNKSFVIKYDGLAYGKGVFVCDDITSGIDALNILSAQYGNDIKILIEDRISGPEISIIGICGKEKSGSHVFKLIGTGRDYKRALDGAKGNNTGGMGAISPHPLWSNTLKEKIYSDIINPTLKGLDKEKLDFQGFLYFGIMLTKDGPNLLEYNVRFGDPEAQVMLPALDEDISPAIINALSNNLDSTDFLIKNKVFIDIALVSKNYPEQYESGKLISYDSSTLADDTIIFYAAVIDRDGNKYSDGGRVLHVVTSANDIEKSREKVYHECNLINFSNMFYRKDIGEDVNG